MSNTITKPVVGVLESMAREARVQLLAVEAKIVSTMRDAVAQAQRNILAVGSLLVQARTICLSQGKGTWERYLSRLNDEYHIPRATAMRLCASYTMAQKQLPPAIVAAAQIRGMNIVSANPDAPFGRYTAAVKAVKVPSKRTMTAEQANDWLNRVNSKTHALNKGNRRTGKGRQQAIAGVLRYFRRIKPTDAPQFFGGLFTTILKSAGIRRTVKL